MIPHRLCHFHGNRGISADIYDCSAVNKEKSNSALLAICGEIRYNKGTEIKGGIVTNDERVIVDTFLSLKNGGAVEFNSMSGSLFAWSKKWISENSLTKRGRRLRRPQ